MSNKMRHPIVNRRTALQAGAVGLLGLGLGDLTALQSLAGSVSQKHRSCIYIFLSGGLAQHESFDPKPDAPEGIRGEFRPIATKTTGLRITEHLPLLAQRSNLWSVVRSLTHKTNNHSDGHLFMLTGRSTLPPGFSPNKPQPSDWPSIASIVRAAVAPANNLPPAIVLPEKLVHNSGRVLPGQFGGEMGRNFDPWFIESSPFDPRAYGAFPTHEFDHQQRPFPNSARRSWKLPSLDLPEGIDRTRFANRLSLLKRIDSQRKSLETAAESGRFGTFHADAVSLLAQKRVRAAFDILKDDPKTLDRYGRNSFGYSLLMARRLVEAGVSLVQVNLGNNESWDTHGNAFPHLKDKLLPPTDRALAALLDDLYDTGLLADTLVIMAGEFGRTPKITTLTGHYKLPGRDHWGAVQSVLFAGGGVPGGTVVGSSDRIGGHPATSPQTPENMAATIYNTLGIPKAAVWHDSLQRPHAIYHGDPIPFA